MNTQGFIAYIKGNYANRGFMADMRKASSTSTRHYAWPMMAPFCDLQDPAQEEAFSLVGYALARSKKDMPNTGNLGATLRVLTCLDKRFPGKGGPTDGRMKRLLACRSSVEMCRLLRPMMGLIQSKGVGVDHTKLLEDILGWGETVRRNWAAAYYA